MAPSNVYWLVLPLVVAISLVYSASRHESWPRIWIHSLRLCLWILGILDRHHGRSPPDQHPGLRWMRSLAGRPRRLGRSRSAPPSPRAARAPGEGTATAAGRATIGAAIGGRASGQGPANRSPVHQPGHRVAPPERPDHLGQGVFHVLGQPGPGALEEEHQDASRHAPGTTASGTSNRLPGAPSASSAATGIMANGKSGTSSRGPVDQPPVHSG